MPEQTMDEIRFSDHLQTLFDLRGYIVVASLNELEIGHEVPELSWFRGGAPGVLLTTENDQLKVIVKQITNRKDFTAQHKLLGIKCRLDDGVVKFYYRAELV